MIKMSGRALVCAGAFAAAACGLTAAYADQPREIQFGLKLNFKTVIKGDAGAVAGQGQLVGRLTDANGKPRSGIAVILSNESRTYRSETREDGGFTFKALRPGPYEVALGSGQVSGLGASEDGRTLILASNALLNPRHVRFGFRFLF